MNTIYEKYGKVKNWLKDAAILALAILLVANYRTPKTEYVYVPEVVEMEIEHEVIKEIEIPTYIEVPLIVELKPEDITPKAKEKRNIPYTKKEIVRNTGFKSYMAYTAITKINSKQYKLQQWAHTDYEGFRIFDGRYITAVGTGVNVRVGQYIDAVLENGTHIPCIVGDIKGNKDTDETNIFTSNGCCLEFIIDNNYLISSVKRSGDCSNRDITWQSPVVRFDVIERDVQGL